VGVSGCGQAALEGGSIEDEDAEKPEETIDPDDEPDEVVVGSAERGVRMASTVGQI